MRTKYPYFKHSDISLYVNAVGGMSFDTSKIREKIAKLYTMPHYVESTIDAILDNMEIVNVESVEAIHGIVSDKVMQLNQRLIPLMRVNIMRSSEALSIVNKIDKLSHTLISFRIKYVGGLSTSQDGVEFTLDFMDMTNVLREYEKLGFILTDTLREELHSIVYDIITSGIEALSITDMNQDKKYLDPITDAISQRALDTINMKMTDYYSLLLYQSMMDAQVAPLLYVKMEEAKVVLDKTHAALLLESCGVEAHHYNQRTITDNATNALAYVEAYLQKIVDNVDDSELIQVSLISLNTIAVNALKFIIDGEIPLERVHIIPYFPSPFAPLDFIVNSLMDSMLQMMTVDSVCLALQSETESSRNLVLPHVDYIIDEVKNTYQLLDNKDTDIVTRYQAVWHTYINCFLTKVKEIRKEGVEFFLKKVRRRDESMNVSWVTNSYKND